MMMKIFNIRNCRIQSPHPRQYYDYSRQLKHYDNYNFESVHQQTNIRKRGNADAS
jgi:hypothetical protein